MSTSAIPKPTSSKSAVDDENGEELGGSGRHTCVQRFFIAGKTPGIKRSTSTAFNYPKTYREFLAMEPRYLANFVRFKHCPKELMEDMISDLNLHLLTPTAKGLLEGKEDRVALYDPAKRGNATSRWAWAHWLNRILTNELCRLIKKHKRAGVSGGNVVSLDVDLEVNKALAEFEKDLFISSTMATSMNTRVFVEQLFIYIEERAGADLANFARVVMEVGGPHAAADVLGYSRSAVTHKMGDIRHWAGRYLRRDSVRR